MPPFFPAALRSGVEMRMSTLGADCAAPLSYASEALLAGAFALRNTEANNETQRYDHVFECSTCGFGPLSLLTVTFPVACQMFIMTAASIGATGDVYVASTVAVNPSKVDSAAGTILVGVNVTLQPQLEVFLDTVAGVSNRGYAVFSATASIAVVDSSSLAKPPDSVTLVFDWGARNVYTATNVVPIMSAYQLVSSIVGLFGIYGGFGLILQLLRTYRREEIRLGRFLWRAGRAGVGRMAANASVRRLELNARRSVQAGPSLAAAAAPAEVDGDAPASALKLSAGREHADSVDVDGPRL